MKSPVSRILFELLSYEFLYDTYVLGAGLFDDDFINPCLKIFPLEDLNSNLFIAKSQTVYSFLKKNFSISLFFPTLGYALTMVGVSEIIPYNENLGNLPVKETVYLLKPTEIKIGFYDFFSKKVKMEIKKDL